MFIYSDKGVEVKAFIELGFINHIFTNKYFGIDFNEYSLMRNDLRIPDAVIEKIFKLNFNADNLVFTKQVHGDKVIIVTHENRENILGTEADAIITKELNLPIVIFTADCVPIF
ncbi:laccase domain-containing protein [Caloramator sp. Dgby_cultured_2]|nr:laccase domain-containing protein [Caloramator sp. Dgby_cultured_2]WDU84112.1 laccase domain-containing protein [Caloramator sp. Dgby_cultured_2]